MRGIWAGAIRKSAGWLLVCSVFRSGVVSPCSRVSEASFAVVSRTLRNTDPDFAGNFEDVTC